MKSTQAMKGPLSKIVLDWLIVLGNIRAIVEMLTSTKIINDMTTNYLFLFGDCGAHWCLPWDI